MTNYVIIMPILEVIILTIPALLAVVYILISKKVIANKSFVQNSNIMHSSVKVTIPVSLSLISLISYGFYIVPTVIMVYSYTGQEVSDTSSIITNTESLLRQLELFISQYERFIVQNDISVITSNGALSIEVNNNIPDSITNTWTRRIHTLDGVINARVSDIRDYISQLNNLREGGHNLDAAMINDLSNKLQTLIARYGHIL